MTSGGFMCFNLKFLDFKRLVACNKTNILISARFSGEKKKKKNFYWIFQNKKPRSFNLARSIQLVTGLKQI